MTNVIGTLNSLSLKVLSHPWHQFERNMTHELLYSTEV